MNPLKELQDRCQAVWLDFLSRGFVASGELKELVEEDGLRGVTSKPSIFEQAIGKSDEYDEAIERMFEQHDRSAGEIFEDLAVEDIRQATGVLLPVSSPISAICCCSRVSAGMRSRHTAPSPSGCSGLDRDQEQSL